MRPVEDWFLDWLAGHRVRFEGIGLPDPMADDEDEAARADVLFEGWQQNFDREGISEDDATEASKRLQAKKSFPLDHFHDLLEIARALASGRSHGVSETPEMVARRESRHCPECDGQGIAVRFRHETHPRGVPVYLHCICPLGRLLKAEGRSFGGAPCLDLAVRPRLMGESGDRYRLPPPPTAANPGGASVPTGRSDFREWWDTRKVEANVYV